jgi:hypothetical protein
MLSYVRESMDEDSALKSREYAEAVRALIAHEDDLLNERMNWLLGVQGLLFAALGSLKEGAYPVPGLVYILIAFGFMISISSKVAFISSDRAIRNVLANWDEHLRFANQHWQDYPPVFAAAIHDRMLMGLDRLLSPRNLLPWAFALGWLVSFILKLKG